MLKGIGRLRENLESGLNLLDDMNGHAGMKRYIQDGYYVISI